MRERRHLHLLVVRASPPSKETDAKTEVPPNTNDGKLSMLGKQVNSNLVSHFGDS